LKRKKERIIKNTTNTHYSETTPCNVGGGGRWQKDSLLVRKYFLEPLLHMTEGKFISTST
jgi:hypothetical protein